MLEIPLFFICIQGICENGFFSFWEEKLEKAPISFGDVNLAGLEEFKLVTIRQLVAVAIWMEEAL